MDGIANPVWEFRDSSMDASSHRAGMTTSFVHRVADDNLGRLCPVGRAKPYRPSALARNGEFPEPIQADLPDRQRPDFPVQSPLQKYSAFPNTQISSISPLSRTTRGAYRDRHGRGAGCGGREGVFDERH